MWEVEPTLVWRVKENGKWHYRRARFIFTREGIIVEPPQPPQSEVKVNEDE